MAGATVPLGGRCDPAFAPVRDAFVRNFTEHGDVGAAVCVTVDGLPVVDLWGGWQDAARQRPWEEHTLVNFFSIGKALTALCAAIVVERGLVDLDGAVGRYWPSFAAAEKDAITYRQVLAHQAGLPAVRAPLPAGAMLDWPHMCAALAAERPWWEPGRRHGYHVNTFGFLVGEVIRRTDGRTPGRFLAEEIAGPLDADVHIGLAAAHHNRVADFLWPANGGGARFQPGEVADDALMHHNAYFNPEGLSGAGVVNTPEWRVAEVPSTNGHGTARGVARVYGELAAPRPDMRFVRRDTLAEVVRVHSDGPDAILGRPSRFGLGVQLTQPERPLGPNQGAFGHFGAGGSLGFCDPEARVGFGYVMNAMGPRWQNPRNRGLVDAVYACL